MNDGFLHRKYILLNKSTEINIKGTKINIFRRYGGISLKCKSNN